MAAICDHRGQGGESSLSGTTVILDPSPPELLKPHMESERVLYSLNPSPSLGLLTQTMISLSGPITPRSDPQRYKFRSCLLSVDISRNQQGAVNTWCLCQQSICPCFIIVNRISEMNEYSQMDLKGLGQWPLKEGLPLGS